MQIYLSELLGSGILVVNDSMRQSADLGYAPALNDQAICFLNEFSSEVNFKYLIYLANKSAELGYLPAYCTLGILYRYHFIWEN